MKQRATRNEASSTVLAPLLSPRHTTLWHQRSSCRSRPRGTSVMLPRPIPTTRSLRSECQNVAGVAWRAAGNATAGAPERRPCPSARAPCPSAYNKRLLCVRTSTERGSLPTPTDRPTTITTSTALATSQSQRAVFRRPRGAVHAWAPHTHTHVRHRSQSERGPCRKGHFLPTRPTDPDRESSELNRRAARSASAQAVARLYRAQPSIE